MESSHVYEESHSCESGWTMYIGSPPQDDDSDDDDGNNSKLIEEEEADSENSNGNKNKNKKKNGNREDEESDDSMASDASSGPSYHRESVPRHERGQAEEEAPRWRSRRPTKEDAERSEVSSKVRKNLKFQTGKRSK